MRRFVRWVLVFSCVALRGVPNAFAQGACDRTCLRGMLDQYLNAVIKHDHAAGPLAIGFRQTENAINVRPGNANSYFDAITSHDGSVALTHPGCGRVENGSPMPPGRFLPPLRPATDAAVSPPAASMNDCVAGLQNFNLSMVVARRIPIIDEETQAVLALAVFIRRPGSPTPRNVFSEWFFIDQGRIRTIYTAMFYPPAELAIPNWAPYDGNWPLPASIVPTPARQ